VPRNDNSSSTTFTHDARAWGLVQLSPMSVGN
jgi:hypothetical protein